MSAAERAAVLIEALPYIQRFAGQVVVVKYGGNALAGASDDDAENLLNKNAVAQAIVLVPKTSTLHIAHCVYRRADPKLSPVLSTLCY